MEKNVHLKNEDLLKRGWTQEKIDYFLISNYGSKGSWLLQTITPFEKKKKFIEFENLSNILSVKEEYQVIQDELTQKAIERIQTKDKIGLPENSLLKKYKQYISDDGDFASDMIIHYPFGEDFSRKGKFYAHSDGCGKVINNKNYASCAGYIEDENGKIVVEFSKEISREKDKFEQIGIEETIYLAKRLNIRNLNLHTDCKGEAYRIGFDLAYEKDTFKKKRDIKDGINKYEKLINDIRDFDDFSIVYIPRQYNSHADSLTKIMVNKYQSLELQRLSEQRSKSLWKSLQVDRQASLYFSHDKMNLVDDSEILMQSAKWSVHSIKHQNKVAGTWVYNFLINNETREFELQSRVNLMEDYSSFLNSLGLSEDLIKEKTKSTDIAMIFNCAQVLKSLNDLEDISVHFPSQGAYAVLNNIIAVPGKTQEEYIELHRAMDQFNKINFGKISNDVIEKMANYVSEDNKRMFSSKNSKNTL